MVTLNIKLWYFYYAGEKVLAIDTPWGNISPTLFDAVGEKNLLALTHLNILERIFKFLIVH